jgi:DNA polymerase-3 subunit delta'
MDIDRSTLYIVNDIKSFLTQITSSLPLHSTRLIQNEEDGKDEFQMLQAQKVLKEAYIATPDKKYIILCGSSFRLEAQNSLLKLLEEPPKNIIFIIITQSKNSILSTILSRVQLVYKKIQKDIEVFPLDLAKLTLQDVYSYIKQKQRINKVEAKDIVESILYTAHINNIILSKKQLEVLSRSMKLLELNSRPTNVLTTVLLHFL